MGWGCSSTKRELGEGLATQRTAEVPLTARRSEKLSWHVFTSVQLHLNGLNQPRSCWVPRVQQSVKMTVTTAQWFCLSSASPSPTKVRSSLGPILACASVLHYMSSSEMAQSPQTQQGRVSSYDCLSRSCLQYSLYPGPLYLSYLLKSWKAWMPVMKISLIMLYSWALLIFPNIFSSSCSEAYIIHSIRKYVMIHHYLLWSERYKA